MSRRQENPETNRLLDRIEGFLIAAVFAGAFVEVANPPQAHRWLVDLFAMTAVAAVGAAIAVNWASSDSNSGPDSNPDLDANARYAGLPRSSEVEDPAHRGRVSGTPRFVLPRDAGPAITPSSARYRAQAGLRLLPSPESNRLDEPPRFFGGGTAHALPWHIPHRSAQNGIAADQARIGSFDIRAASVVGPGHRCEPGNAEPRQDAYRVGRSADDRYAVIAVADGLSSARMSDVGANAAASHAVRILREQLSRRAGIADLDAVDVFAEIAQHLVKEARNRNAMAAELATVLITAVLEQPLDGDGVARGWVAWIGDGSGWLLDQEAGLWIQRFGEVKNVGEYASNAVSSTLPDQPHLVRQTEFHLDIGGVFVLATDGIADAWSADQRVNRFFAERWRTPPQAPYFLNDVGYDAPQRNDDRTAVAVWNEGRQ